MIIKEMGLFEVITSDRHRRLLSQTERIGDCWRWCGTVDWRGFGVIGLGKVKEPARDVLYKLCRGEWEGELGNTCGNAWCVFPYHWKEGKKVRRQPPALPCTTP